MARTGGHAMYAQLRGILSNPETAARYAVRVLELEAEGCCTSDAQGIADVEFLHEAWKASGQCPDKGAS